MRLALLCAAGIMIAGAAHAQEEISATRELAALAEAYDEFSRPSEHGDSALQTTQQFVTRFLAFEAEHRGSHAGLMAVRFIVDKAAEDVHVNNPWAVGRREALKRLHEYGHRNELPSLLGDLVSGSFEPHVEGTLRSLAKDEGASAANRAFARLTLARWMLSNHHSRRGFERRLQELGDGAQPRFPSERAEYQLFLDQLPPWPQLEAWEKEAHEILHAIASSKQLHRNPAFRTVDPQGYSIRLDEEATSNQKPLSKIAGDVLFKELHLKAGKMAPDLSVRLVSGEEWSLTEQRGKLVIIQFSFKGCPPCERQYPVLRDIQKAYGERVSILSVMGDKERKDTEKAVSSGKLTWDVHWDGRDGPVADHWRITGHPTVYLVGPDGKIAADGLRGERLKAQVRALLENSRGPL